MKEIIGLAFARWVLIRDHGWQTECQPNLFRKYVGGLFFLIFLSEPYLPPSEGVTTVLESLYESPDGYTDITAL